MRWDCGKMGFAEEGWDVVRGLLLDLISKHVVEMSSSNIYCHKKLTVAQYGPNDVSLSLSLTGRVGAD